MAASRQSDYLGALKAHCGTTLDIVQGRYQSKEKYCRKCGATWIHYEGERDRRQHCGIARRRRREQDGRLCAHHLGSATATSALPSEWRNS